jgi:hypothetical protein
MRKQRHRHTENLLRPELEAVKHAVASNPFWGDYLGTLGCRSTASFSVHLAVFVEPFLGYVLDGSKTVESRFSVTRCPPFGRVRSGDVVILKRTGGPVVGLARVTAVWSYCLDPDSWRTIRETFARALRAQDPEFWESRRRASYATLMMLDQVSSIEPIQWRKADRRGWVVVESGEQPSLFEVNHDIEPRRSI